MATFGNRRILLTADVGPEGLNEAAEYAESTSLFIQQSPTTAVAVTSPRLSSTGGLARTLLSGAAMPLPRSAKTKTSIRVRRSLMPSPAGATRSMPLAAAISISWTATTGALASRTRP
jgi:hypothetical protein